MAKANLYVFFVLHKITRNKIENIVTANTCSDEWTISMHPYVTTLFIVPFQFTTHHGGGIAENRHVELPCDRSIDISFELIPVVFGLPSYIRYA